MLNPQFGYSFSWKCYIAASWDTSQFKSVQWNVLHRTKEYEAHTGPALQHNLIRNISIYLPPQTLTPQTQNHLLMVLDGCKRWPIHVFQSRTSETRDINKCYKKTQETKKPWKLWFLFFFKWLATFPFYIVPQQLGKDRAALGSKSDFYVLSAVMMVLLWFFLWWIFYLF